ncbi:unnamed protein product [Musa acuminata subsp. burmannicoides]
MNIPIDKKHQKLNNNKREFALIMISLPKSRKNPDFKQWLLSEVQQGADEGASQNLLNDYQRNKNKEREIDRKPEISNPNKRGFPVKRNPTSPARRGVYQPRAYRRCEGSVAVEGDGE